MNVGVADFWYIKDNIMKGNVHKFVAWKLLIVGCKSKYTAEVGCKEELSLHIYCKMKSKCET